MYERESAAVEGGVGAIVVCFMLSNLMHHPKWGGRDFWHDSGFEGVLVP